MDAWGNDENRDIMGNPMDNNIHGGYSHGDVYGNPPSDVYGHYSPSDSMDDAASHGVVDFVGSLLKSFFG